MPRFTRVGVVLSLIIFLAGLASNLARLTTSRHHCASNTQTYCKSQRVLFRAYV